MQQTANPSEPVLRFPWNPSGSSRDEDSIEPTPETAGGAVPGPADLDVAVHWCTVYPMSASAARWERRRAQRAAARAKTQIIERPQSLSRGTGG